ncbi:transposase [Candidatus Saganbacteria bacterium]|nr:transposase [Candidatus Saganbacteria bacterium]
MLRHDPLFQLSVKNKKNKRWQLRVDELALQPTISRLENRITPQEIAKINDFLLQNYMKAAAAEDKKPKTIILDTDSTNDPTHGNQQMSMFNGYYEETVYHPLLITEPESTLFLGAYLRPGNVHTADKVLDHISPILQKLKNNFPTATLIFRADK